MKLNELLNITNYPTDIILYESSSESWDASKETLIKKDITVSDYYNNDDCIKELYDKYKNYKVIGVAIEANTLRITIYKESSIVEKKTGDITLKEVKKLLDNNDCTKYENCNGCPWKHLNCGGIAKVLNNLNQEIEVKENENINWR